jgi:hypothetical protein
MQCARGSHQNTPRFSNPRHEPRPAARSRQACPILLVTFLADEQWSSPLGTQPRRQGLGVRWQGRQSLLRPDMRQSRNSRPESSSAENVVLAWLALAVGALRDSPPAMASAASAAARIASHGR